MQNKNPWWVEEQPLTISAIQVNVEKNGDKVYENYVSKYGFNTEQLYYLIAQGYMNYFTEEKHGKMLDDYLVKTKKGGTREILYTNIHCMSHEMSKEHPEFSQRNKNGDIMYGYNVFNFICVNPEGPFHKQFLKDVADMASHDIDGIFLDGPVMLEGGCYCETCQKTFMKKFGHSIFEGTSRELTEMRVSSVTGHVKEVSEVVKSVNPNIALYLNNSALRHDFTGSNTRKIYDYVDLIGAEGGFHQPLMNMSMFWQNSAFMKHLEAITGDPRTANKPIVNFFAANESAIRNLLHTPCETMLTYAHTLAGGANVWYGPHFDIYEAMELEGMNVAKQMNEFILDNKSLFKPSKTCARVAVMWSEDTANNYSSSVEESDFTKKITAPTELGDHRTALFSVIDILEKNHIQFDIVDEINIKKDEHLKYQAIILPTVACMSDEIADKLSNFVKNGGNILANYAVALYDETGVYLNSSKLGKVFGFKGEPKVFATKNAFMFKDKDDVILKDLYSPRLPAPPLDIEWQFDDNVEVIFKTSASMPSVYETMPTERYPSIVKNTYGKGQAYYISGTMFEKRNVRNILDYENIIKGFCNVNSTPVVVSNEPGLYETVLRRTNDKYVFHIVNMTGNMSRPYEKVVPLYNVPFTLNLNGFDIPSKEIYDIKSIRGAKISNLSQKDNIISFTLDKLSEYEIISIE